MADFNAPGGSGKTLQWLGAYQGYIAVNTDPLSEGRVKLRIPQVFDTAISGWAVPMVPLTYIPQVGTKVSVMFLGGDPSKPIWFGNFALPNSSSGVFVTSTAPSNPEVGAIWYDTASGMEMYEWNGASWVAYQFGSGAIQDGAIVASKIEATAIDGMTITGAHFIATSASGDFLGYSGTPVTGNLIMALSPVSGTDSYVNKYPAGVSLTNYSLGIQSVLSPNGTLYWTSPNSSLAPYSVPYMGISTVDGGNVIEISSGEISSGKSPAIINVADSAAAPNISAANVAGSGLVQVQAAMSVVGTLFFGNPSASLSTDATGYPTLTDEAGLSLNVSGSKLANPSSSGTYPITVTNTTLTSLGFMAVPGGDAEAGSTYTLHASGQFSLGSTAPSSAEMIVFWGGTAGNNVGSVSIPVLTTGLTNAPWIIDAEITWLSVYECAVDLVLRWRTASGVGGSVSWFGAQTTTSLDTSVSHNLSLGFQWGSAPSGTALNCFVFRAAKEA